MSFVLHMDNPPSSIRFEKAEKKRIIREAKLEGRTFAGFVRFHINELVKDRELRRTLKP